MTGRILYGYRMEKGIAVVEQTEGVYVQKLFDDYTNDCTTDRFRIQRRMQ